MEMKSIEIPKSTPKYLYSQIFDAIEEAYGFLCSRYGYRFNDVKIIFQPSANRSRYFTNEYQVNEHHRIPTATISCRKELMLYEKKSIGKYKLKLNVGNKIQMSCALIHELTHHIQFLEGRIFSEVETTKKISYPEWYKFLIS